MQAFLNMVTELSWEALAHSPQKSPALCLMRPLEFRRPEKKVELSNWIKQFWASVGWLHPESTVGFWDMTNLLSSGQPRPAPRPQPHHLLLRFRPCFSFYLTLKTQARYWELSNFCRGMEILEKKYS